MTNIEKIIITANQLANKGKKPTVALIKANLVNPTPLPQIIAALKTWQHEPENCVMPEQETNTEDKKEESPTAPTLTMEDLNNALAPIQQELAEVKRLLQQLTKG